MVHPGVEGEETGRSPGGLPPETPTLWRSEEGGATPVGPPLCGGPIGRGRSSPPDKSAIRPKGPESTLAVGLRPLGFGSGRDTARLRSNWRTPSEASGDGPRDVRRSRQWAAGWKAVAAPRGARGGGGERSEPDQP